MSSLAPKKLDLNEHQRVLITIASGINDLTKALIELDKDSFAADVSLNIGKSHWKWLRDDKLGPLQVGIAQLRNMCNVEDSEINNQLNIIEEMENMLTVVSSRISAHL